MMIHLHVKEATAEHYSQHHLRNQKSRGGDLNDIHKNILRLLEQDFTKKEAAQQLGINVHTLDRCLRDIYKMENVHSMTAAVAKAIREKII